jgi:L-alanine-DL-glutamate epimerase-like enolase superfamily enzyme
MRLKFDMWPIAWPMKEVLAISRGTQTDQPTLQVRLIREDGIIGRGEACGIPYDGDTPETIAIELEKVREVIEAGVDRQALLEVLPYGGARMAIDAALWDMEVKSGGPDPYIVYGLEPKPVMSAYTIGIRDLADYEATARTYATYPLLKIKVDGNQPVSAIQAVRRGAPNAKLIVDTNQAWSVNDLKAYASIMADLGVVLLEQPIKVGDEAGLDGWRSPVPLCADELINSTADLDKAQGRFDVVNIKLDKAGGLTAAMALADAVEARGMQLMVGCMAGSSLSMAPAMVLAQRCAFVDLDGPMLQTEDVETPLVYVNGVVDQPHLPALWA